MAVVPGLVVPAHTQEVTHTYWVHYPDHEPREGDPHFKDFHHFRESTKATAKCAIGEHRDDYSECFPPQEHWPIGLEVHHALIEFSLMNGVDLKWLERDFPGVSNPDELGAWVESAANLMWLCVLPGAPVLMADGMTKAIEDVVVGESVVTHDGSFGTVEAVQRKRYRGEAFRFGGAAFTPTHRLLTHGGWACAAQIARQVWVHGPDVVRLRCEQQQVRQGIIGPVPVNVVDALGGEEFAANDFGHGVAVFHHQDELVSNAHRDSHVPSGCDLAPASNVDTGARLETVEAQYPTGVGAVECWPGAPMRSPMEAGGADGASYEMCWVATVPTTVFHSGWVHDLSVSHNHSFVAGGVAAHNCVRHHRGEGGEHTVTASDFEGLKYVSNMTSGHA